MQGEVARASPRPLSGDAGLDVSTKLPTLQKRFPKDAKKTNLYVGLWKYVEKQNLARIRRHPMLSTEQTRSMTVKASTVKATWRRRPLETYYRGVDDGGYVCMSNEMYGLH